MTDDPVLAWHEAFVVAGFEVERLVMDQTRGDLAAFGVLQQRRLALWRGFNDSVNIIVEAPLPTPPPPLVYTAHKAPSGGVSKLAWLSVCAWSDIWWFGFFARNHVGFIYTLSSIRDVIRGVATPDTDGDRRSFMHDRWKIANEQIRRPPPDTWLNVERTPGRPRPP